jgi:hypothetical protein
MVTHTFFRRKGRRTRDRAPCVTPQEEGWLPNIVCRFVNLGRLERPTCQFTVIGTQGSKCQTSLHSLKSEL